MAELREGQHRCQQPSNAFRPHGAIWRSWRKSQEWPPDIVPGGKGAFALARDVEMTAQR